MIFSKEVVSSQQIFCYQKSNWKRLTIFALAALFTLLYLTFPWMKYDEGEIIRVLMNHRLKHSDISYQWSILGHVKCVLPRAVLDLVLLNIFLSMQMMKQRIWDIFCDTIVRRWYWRIFLCLTKISWGLLRNSWSCFIAGRWKRWPPEVPLGCIFQWPHHSRTLIIY